MNCDDARTAYLSGQATSDQIRHLETCAQCGTERTGLEAFRSSLDDPMFWEEPSGTLEDRLVNLIGGHIDADTATPLHRRWWAAAGIAAAVAVALMGAWTVTRTPSADWEVTLPGTVEAPQASGVVRGWNEPEGTRLALEVAGLPEAPTGSVYELWFSEGSRHISSGTFVAADGVQLWVGVSRRDFPRLWITLEPLDDDESPSGVTVMDTG